MSEPASARLPRSRVFGALVLAGGRSERDPVAVAAGVPHKALVPICGTPMIGWVLRSLEAASAIGRIAVSSGDPSSLEDLEEVRALRARGRLELLRSDATPAESVLAVLRRLRDGEHLFVTTADHPLLRPAMVDLFCQAAAGQEADVWVGVVAEATLRSRFPGTRRTLLSLRGERVTGANMFALRAPGAVAAVRFWERADEVRKRPWRLVSLFGPTSLALFALRRLDLQSALERASRRIGVRIAALRLPDPECAVDVDGSADLALARELLGQRRDRLSPEP